MPDRERSRGHSGHTGEIVGVVAFMIHKAGLNARGEILEEWHGSRKEIFLKNVNLGYLFANGKIVLDNP